jgi:hypothetical protein
MSGFVSSPAAAAAVPATIEHDGWYPATDPAQLRASARIGEVVTPQRLQEAVLGAMVSVEAELAAWRALQTAASLAAVAPGRTLGGEPRLVVLYRRAIAGFVAADLAETHRDITATAEGSDRGEAKALSADEHRRNATHAIRDMLGQTRTAVELI